VQQRFALLPELRGVIASCVDATGDLVTTAFSERDKL
jgi:hypothetical protein